MKDLFGLTSIEPTILAAFSAFGAAVIALIAIIVSVWGLALQRQHNRLSVRPIATFDVADYEDDLFVRLENMGAGPLKIDAFTVKCNKSGKVTTSLIEQMSAKGIDTVWENFTGDARGRTIGPGGNLVLLGISDYDGEDMNFAPKRNAVRAALRTIELKVTFSDIYGKTIGTEKRSLNWFGRHSSDYDCSEK